MITWLRHGALVLCLTAACCLALSQTMNPPMSPPGPGSRRERDVRLPNGKSQRDEILKAEYQQNLKDTARLAELSQELKQDMEQGDRFVLSLSTLKKTEEIEKLIKKIRSRLHSD